jgi:hypothetical protein
MFQEFPEPPRAQQFSELLKMRLGEARKAGGTRETVTVDVHGEPVHVEVISLLSADLYFNPATRRIRAQRSHDPEREAILDEAPWSAEGQQYLHDLLQADPAKPAQRDPDFDKLKEDLHQFGQNEPGLITRHGILVNGNTRAAALRELDKSSPIRVGVLPESFTWKDVHAVELALQLRKDHRRGYSYINHLLALEEQAALGRSPEAIAKDFRIKTRTYEQDRWILRVVQEQIERSKTDGSSLRLVHFEDMKEKFKELHRDYMSLAASDPEGAEILKETRLSGILLGFAKTDVRYIESEFQDQYLSKTLSLPTTSGADSEPDDVQIPGLGMSVPKESARVARARQLHQEILLLKTRHESPKVSQEVKAASGVRLEEVREAFNGALDRAGRDIRLRRRKQLAPERLREACVAIDQTVDEYVKARGSMSLDEVAFDDAVQQLRVSLRGLARQAGRSPSAAQGSGVAWLLEAVGVEGSDQ